jgi:hypothetical protein
MMRRGTAGNVGRPEELASLLALAPELPGPWGTRSASIALAPIVLSAANINWFVYVGAYAQRNHRTNVRKVHYGVELTMFCNQAPRSESGRSQLRAWQRRITKQLRDLGYEGRWQERAPGGRPACYFSKDLPRLALVPAAVRKLQRVQF